MWQPLINLFDLGLITSLFIGGTITATSIGITVRVLKDLKKNRSREGEIVLGAAVLDGIFGVVLLAIMYDFSQSGEVNLIDTAGISLYCSLLYCRAYLGKIHGDPYTEIRFTDELPRAYSYRDHLAGTLFCLIGTSDGCT